MGKHRNRSLTLKQQKWLDLYLTNGGHGTNAARDAGYGGSYVTLANISKTNLRNERIQREIKHRMNNMRVKGNFNIKTRLQRKQWWSDIMDDDTVNMGDRLRASELLGKSEADFKEDNGGDVTNVMILSSQEERALLKASDKLRKELSAITVTPERVSDG